MIHSVHHGKGGLDQNEDTRTSTIIGQLLHLPDGLFWQILLGACDRSHDMAGFQNAHDWEITSQEFWPGWDAEGTVNSNFVEPDVFIRCEGHDVLIEAKRFDENQQSGDQWEKEIQAYRNVYGQDSHLVFIALGGINNHQAQELTRQHQSDSVTVIYCRWTDVLREVRKPRHDLSANQSRILDDVKKSFDCFGFYTGRWLGAVARSSVADVKYINALAPVDFYKPNNHNIEVHHA